ncbi:MAG: four helix bundle protein [Ignavibacteriales bacterium]|nr:four helix bundle protein [Ignavibacteriales bacterium]
MTKTQPYKPFYDLEDRTYKFAKDCRLFVKTLQKSKTNIEDTKQLFRSSCSVGANYRVANNALSKNVLLMKIKISRKEFKESEYWFGLINETNDFKDEISENLIKEPIELKKIFSSIMKNHNEFIFEN